MLGQRRVAGFPKTESGCRRYIVQSGWASREVQGKGGRGGIRTEYQPPTDVLVQIRAFLDANPDFFKERRKVAPARRHETPSTPLVAREPAAPYRLAAPEGFVLVPRYDVAGSMGNGHIVHSEQIVDHLAFRAEWVRTELGTNPASLVLISAVGDSMEPTLRAHDLLLIDRSFQAVKQDAIYAFAVDGELRVKRIQRLFDGSLVIKSDNPAYGAENLSPEQASGVNIIGRIVWSGRRM